MYVPAHFKEDRVPVLHEAMRTIGLGTLVTLGAGELEASHVPMLVEPEPGPFGTLTGHVARGNPQWRGASSNVQALAIFLGPHAYVTPSWYTTKAETGKVVPTWNYLAVHATGEITFFDDREELRTLVSALTDVHETVRPAPWAVSDAPADYIDKMLKAIVGFRLTITRLDGKWKMSQNRTNADFVGVQNGLRERGLREGGGPQQALAQAMTGSPRPTLEK